MKALRGRVSGLCQPTYVLDIPGGHGKVPIGPDLPPGAAAITRSKTSTAYRHAYPPSPAVEPSQDCHMPRAK